MEVAITKMSSNGQVVIPVEIREEANIKPSTRFIVFNDGENIIFKPINEETLRNDIALAARIRKSEDDIKKGKFIKADTKMSDEEIDNLLVG